MDVANELKSLQLKAYVGDHVILHDVYRDKYSRVRIDGINIELDSIGDLKIGYLIDGSWKSSSEFYSTKEEVVCELTGKLYAPPEINISDKVISKLPTLHFGDDIYYRNGDRISFSKLHSVDLGLFDKNKFSLRYTLKNSKLLNPSDAYLSQEQLINDVSNKLTNLGF